MTITNYVQTIGAADHKLMMRDLKPLSGLGRDEHAAFWQAWQALSPTRREEIAHAMVDLAEDNIDLDFNEVLLWCLDDDEASVRTHAIEGLWENDSMRLMHRLIDLLRADSAPVVRAVAAMALSRFAYEAVIEELEPADAEAVQQVLLDAILDPQTPLDVRRRSLESVGYFGDLDEVQRQIELAYRSDEQLLRESALAAMGRTLLPRWLPMIERELTSVSPALRYEAARAAGEMAENARTLLPKLAALINDDDGEVVLMTIWALGQIGGEHARRLLQRMRKSQNEAYREAATEALEELSLGLESGDRGTSRLHSWN